MENELISIPYKIFILKEDLIMGKNNRNRHNPNQNNNGPRQARNFRNILPNYRPVFTSSMSLIDGAGACSECHASNRPDRKQNNNQPSSSQPKKAVTRSFGDDDNVAEAPYVKFSMNQEQNLIHVDEYEFMENFLNDYDSALSSMNQQKELIHDCIIPLARITTNYYNNKYSDVRGTMDSVFQIMTTEIFAKSLLAVLKQCIRDGNDWDDTFSEWDTDYETVGYMISILLGTKRASMTLEVEDLYKRAIGAGIYKEEINAIIKKTHVTEELATDLMLRNPIVADHMKDFHIATFYQSFLASMILHAEDNVEILDRETQGKLFKFLYGDSKVAAKIIGKYLSQPEKTDLGAIEKMIYTEFKCMLYDKLNQMDISMIEYILGYIVKQKQELGDVKIIFEFDTAAEYPNLNRALMHYIQEDKDAKKCFNL